MWCLKFSVVLLFCSGSWLAEAIKIQREHSLQPPFTEQAESLMFWDLTGAAQLGGHFIRLTTDEPEKKGAIWNNFPLIANDWEFQLHFHIHGKGVNLNGDGMALWYTKDTKKTGPVFGSKDFFNGLGVFIDTFENQREPHNHRHPYISAMVNNGTLHYEHGEDGTMTQIGGCHVPIRNLEVPTKMAVSYINQALAIYLDIEGLNQWRLCFKSEGVHLPTGYYFGVTSSTSDVTDNHDIIAVTTLNLDSLNQNWMDKSDIVPFAENVVIPEKYFREGEDSSEKKYEDIETNEDSSDELRMEQMRIKREQQQFFEHHAHPEKEKHINNDAHPEEEKLTDDDSTAPTTSWLRMLIYISGGLIIITVAISTYKKYAERRRERMQKRLF